jgi:predicted nucleic acid-binding protein
MILVDTNIWISHLRYGEQELVLLLERNEVLVHSWIRGELALGNLKRREEFLYYLRRLPQLPSLPDDAILSFIEEHRLYSQGIGWIDAGILASCAAYPCRIWSRDERLTLQAKKFGLSYHPSRGRERK